MKKLENLTEEAKQILQPIKQRPYLEPRKDFVNELHNRLAKEKTKKKSGLPLYPVFATASALLIFALFILSFQIGEENATNVESAFDIKEKSQMNLVTTIEYGNEEGEVGLFYEGMNETLPVSVAGFDRKQGILYILDEARSQVVMKDGEGNTTTFSLKNDLDFTSVLQDILVTDREEIYILDSGASLVYQYNIIGELIKTYDLSQLDLYFPDALAQLENEEIVVSQRQEMFVNLKTMSFMDEEELPFQFKPVNRKESKLQLNEEENQMEITLFSNLGMGNRAIKVLNDDQFIYVQTILPPVFTPISESHVLALNKGGAILGGARIPVERFIEKPQNVENFIVTDGNRIYQLIPEKEHVALYELTLGKEYESFIEQQVEEVQMGFNYETFGEPFPELEEEINKLFINGKIEYGKEDSLNGVAIDEYGTVVIDFKDFLAPSPASVQSQNLHKALHSATSEKFPEIQQIYFQFDGSFSAWCYWLESTEEPWKREEKQSSEE